MFHLISPVAKTPAWFLLGQSNKVGRVELVLELQLFPAYIYLKLDKLYKKLEGVGPVDNRPSINKLHHFFQKNKKKNVTCDM